MEWYWNYDKRWYQQRAYLKLYCISRWEKCCLKRIPVKVLRHPDDFGINLGIHLLELTLAADLSRMQLRWKLLLPGDPIDILSYYQEKETSVDRSHEIGPILWAPKALIVREMYHMLV